MNSNSSASAHDQVANIFKTAGKAFSHLGELTSALQNKEAGGGHKWRDEDISELQQTVIRFSEDMHRISLRVRDTTVSQISNALQKRASENQQSSTPITPSMPNTSSNNLGGQGSPSKTAVVATKSKPAAGNAEFTLNMLNASDGDMDSHSHGGFDSNGVISP